jgi:hypothetical protein
MKEKRPDLVLYHARCPDGFGSAWLYWRELGQQAVYVPTSYGQDPPSVRGRHVLMIDVSFPRSVIRTLSDQAASFRLLDHHLSAHEELADLPCAHFDLGLSGVGLAWQDLHGKAPAPTLVKFIQARDLDKPMPEGGNQVLHVLDSLPYDFEAWERLAQRVEEDLPSVVAEGEVMEQRFESLATRFLAHATPVEMGGHRGLAINAPMEFASALGDRLSEHASFSFTWFMDAMGQIHGSWRSRRIDVIPLAQKYGGGGHPYSSGARLTVPELVEVLGHGHDRQSCCSRHA